MEDLVCYICYCGETAEKRFASEPCDCKGTNVIHEDCIHDQLLNGFQKCTICKTAYNSAYGFSRVSVYTRGPYTVTKSFHLYTMESIDLEDLQHYMFTFDNYHTSFVRYSHVDDSGSGFVTEYAMDYPFQLLSYYTIQNHKKHGEARNYYLNQHVKLVAQYVNNEIHGTYKTYRNNGVLLSCMNYKNGVLNGLMRTYHKDGTPKYLQYNVNAEAHGIRHSWINSFDGEGNENDDGQERHYLYSVCNYVHGEKDGVRTKYNSDGGIYETAEYKEGYKDGVWKKYHPNGSLERIMYYAKAESYGLIRTYHPNGQLRDLDYSAKRAVMGHHVYGLDDYEGDEQDTIESIIRHVAENGVYMTHSWHDNGQLRLYSDDVRNFEWRRDGVMCRCHYVKGLYRIWHPNGQLWSIFYNPGPVLDMKETLVQTWNMDGTLREVDWISETDGEAEGEGWEDDGEEAEGGLLGDQHHTAEADGVGQ